MPNFRTKITPSDFPFALRHEQPILALGSCFAENIGERLRRLQFPIQLNPFGILYHPMSILDNLKRLQNDVPFSEKDLWEHQGLWHSFAHHSVFSKMDKMRLQYTLNYYYCNLRS